MIFCIILGPDHLFEERMISSIRHSFSVNELLRNIQFYSIIFEKNVG